MSKIYNIFLKRHCSGTVDQINLKISPIMNNKLINTFCEILISLLVFEIQDSESGFRFFATPFIGAHYLLGIIIE